MPKKRPGPATEFEGVWPGKIQKGTPTPGTHAKHDRSERLAHDGRVVSPPRRHTVVLQNEAAVVTIRIYPGLQGDAPGSDLITVALLNKSSGREMEWRFDEIYPIWVTFKKEEDDVRTEKARIQIERTGGIASLSRHYEHTVK